MRPTSLHFVTDTPDPTGGTLYKTDNMLNPGDCYLVDKKGVTAEEAGKLYAVRDYTYRTRWFHRVFKIDPKKSNGYKKSTQHILAKRAMWPAVKTICIQCPICNMAFASTEHVTVTETDGGAVSTTKIICPFNPTHIFQIAENNIKYFS